jgi:hypothetical protein
VALQPFEEVVRLAGECTHIAGANVQQVAVIACCIGYAAPESGVAFEQQDAIRGRSPSEQLHCKQRAAEPSADDRNSAPGCRHRSIPDPRKNPRSIAGGLPRLAAFFPRPQAGSQNRRSGDGMGLPGLGQDDRHFHPGLAFC